MKRWIAMLLVIVMSLALVACGNKVEKLIADINTLDREITMNDEDRVEKIFDRYSALSDEDKAKITNYEILEAASDTIGELRAREITLKAAGPAAVEYVKSRLKIPSSLNVIKTEIYPSKKSTQIAYVRIQFTSENSFGGKGEDTFFLKIKGFIKPTIQQSHYDDAHADWKDTKWSKSELEDVDLGNRYMASQK